MTLSNMSIIPDLHKNIFKVAQSPQKGFQVASEDETLILKKNSTDIIFDEKMANKTIKGFLLTTNFYKSTNDAALLDLKNRNTEVMEIAHTEGMAVKKQYNMTTKKIATQKIHASKLHMNIGHPGEDRMHVTTNQLQYIVKETLEVFED